MFVVREDVRYDVVFEGFCVEFDNGRGVDVEIID